MDKRKVILAVTTDLNFDQRMVRIGDALIEMGFDVLLVGRELSSSPPLRPRKFKQHRFNCWMEKGFLFYAEYNLRLVFFLWSTKFDFVTANDLDTVVGSYIGSIFKNCKRLFDAHEYFVEVPELKGRPIKKGIWKVIERLFVPRFKRLYTVNETLAELFQRRLGKKFIVVRNVPDIKDDNQVQKPIDKPYLLYQGAVNQGRGLEVLIRSMRQIEGTLKIAGDGDILQDLKNLTQELKLDHKVDFLGKLSPKDLKNVTSGALLGFNLLENTSLNYYYSLANKFFDYAFAGIPQISMNFPEYQRMNKQYPVAKLIDKLEVNQLVSVINDTLNDVEYLAEMPIHAARMRTEIHWRNESDQLREIYY